MFNVFDIAGSGMSAQSLRLNTTASNLANADSVTGDPETAYRARHPHFRSVMSDWNRPESVRVGVDNIVRSGAPVEVRYQPEHPEADADGYVYGSNVNAVEEMVNMLSASRAYQNNIEVISTTREMMQRTLQMGQ
ncbi:flagellar basal body rod protein FlgC [Natronospira bacteriovora]|uniref:Flagellar basal-body rod protein FlgC n=1 Tax=Natronospira bacteriovora TaxID=3069753 RepID=A0ABU0W3A4_9GAMM|nr:flagellar basal body rod protein FlgC [Natronospira sp. AB-CW4]MDQ2068494.1 flagellar basal body rod protein FlgC [Natronospira sp. AB-CW4]